MTNTLNFSSQDLFSKSRWVCTVIAVLLLITQLTIKFVFRNHSDQTFVLFQIGIFVMCSIASILTLVSKTVTDKSKWRARLFLFFEIGLIIFSIIEYFFI